MRFRGRELQFQQWQAELEHAVKLQQQPGVAGARRQMSKSDVFSFRNLYHAYLACRKNKRHTRSALQFEINHEEELLNLEEQLKTRTYRPLPSVCFIVESPKPREVFAANFRDRIVHHLLVQYLEPRWEPLFIHDSYACRKCKGTHAAVKRLRVFMRKATHNGSCKAYYLQIDIKSFFVSINKQILFQTLIKKEPRPEIIWLLNVIIFDDPAANPVLTGNPALFNLIPKHKSLFSRQNQTGLPIGNYTSQFFANVHLNKLDQFVKHHLKCRHYIRYVDDMVLLSRSREELESWEERIAFFLKTELQLELNPMRKKLASVYNGCNFVGYIVRPTHLLIRNRVVNNLKSKLANLRNQLVVKKNGKTNICFDPQRIDFLQSLLASYLGQFQHASAFRLKRSILNYFNYLSNYFSVTNNGKLERIDIPPRFADFRAQYRWFQRRYPENIIFIQVGKFYECYRHQARVAFSLLGLKRGRKRMYLGEKAAFHVNQLDMYLKKAVTGVNTIAIIDQTGRIAGNVMERRLTWIYRAVNSVLF